MEMIDKVMHFPISFVIKTNKQKAEVLQELTSYVAERANGMRVIEDRYNKAIEEIITINELKSWTNQLANNDIDNIIKDIGVFYNLEMNLNAKEFPEQTSGMAEQL